MKTNPVICAFGVFAGVVYLVFAIYVCTRPVNFPEPAKRVSPPPVHVHVFGKWSAPEIRSNAWVGTQQWQTRLCESCGEAETNLTVLSAAAKAK